MIKLIFDVIKGLGLLVILAGCIIQAIKIYKKDNKSYLHGITCMYIGVAIILFSYILR